MSRRRSGQAIHGILLLDKPVGMSSNQALQRVRHLLQASKAGHTGTLDPFATGMLPLCLGEASKTAFFMSNAAKTYRATAMLGRATSTGDIEGEIIRELPPPVLDEPAIEAVLSRFRGQISQVPPMYSAIKHQGQPLYKLARQGVEVERKPRQVTLFRLEVVSWQPPLLTFEVYCSKGTYIRTLAEDIGHALGSCAHLVSLRRRSVDPFPEHRMVGLNDLEQAIADARWTHLLLPVDAGIADWPRVELDDEAVAQFAHGNRVSSNAAGGMQRVYDDQGRILGLGEAGADGLLQPRRVFASPLPGSPP